jgi:SOS-response transcriptional repressor LexA
MNKTEKLRSIIRESIQEYIKEIDSAGTTAMYEAKMKACDEAIEKRMKKIEMAESLEEMQGMFDESKTKDLKTEIKALEKQKAKYGKMLEKLNKGKEVVTEEPMEEAPVDEADITRKAQELEVIIKKIEAKEERWFELSAKIEG